MTFENVIKESMNRVIELLKNALMLRPGVSPASVTFVKAPFA